MRCSVASDVLRMRAATGYGWYSTCWYRELHHTVKLPATALKIFTQADYPTNGYCRKVAQDNNNNNNN